MSIVEMVKSLIRAVRTAYLEEKITFSDRLFLLIAQRKLILVSSEGDNCATTNLSVEDAKEVFQSIKRACQANGIEKIEVPDLRWKTDARIRALWPGRVVIQVSGPSIFAVEVVRREDAVAAIAEFDRKFGLQ